MRVQAPVILVHGGAGRCPEALQAEALANVQRAVEVARVAARGGDAVDAAVAAVRHLEQTPCFNAGRGACLNAEGRYETDAGIMRASDGAIGAVGAAPNLADAILVARRVMEASPHNLIVAEGVRAFGRAEGVGTFDFEAMDTPKAQRNYARALAGAAPKDGRADTVGAIVLDAQGQLCAAGSTGGVLLKAPGRVGDTALVGAGFFADPVLGACVATGAGEAIMRRVLCYALLEAHHREGGDLQARAQAACDALRAETGAAVGVLAITPDGASAVAHACPHMSWARGVGEGDIAAGLNSAPG